MNKIYNIYGHQANNIYQALDIILKMSNWDQKNDREKFITLFQEEEQNPKTNICIFIKKLEQIFPKKKHMGILFVGNTIFKSISPIFPDHTLLQKYVDEYNVSPERCKIIKALQKEITDS